MAPAGDVGVVQVCQDLGGEENGGGVVLVVSQ
jgi:hypothetical protein